MAACLKAVYAIVGSILFNLLLPFYIVKSLISSLFAGRFESVDGSVVVVTGAANGLGKELARQLVHKHQCKVICVDMKKDDLDNSLEEINRGAKEVQAEGFICDITSVEQVERLRDFVVQKHGKLDMLINNAAFLYMGSVGDGSTRHIERCINVNLLGNIWITKSFLPTFKSQKSGRIVFVNSLAGLSPDHGLAIYSISKCGLTAFASVLDKELHSNPDFKNITISSAHPWFVETNPIFRHIYRANLPPLSVSYAAKLIIDGARRKCFEFTVPGWDLGARLTSLNARILPKSYGEIYYKLLGVEIARAPPELDHLYDQFTSPDFSHQEVTTKFTEAKVQPFFESKIK